MATKTAITDIIVPSVFIPYLIERTAEKSDLISSGIVVPDPQLDVLAQAGGRLINVPFFKDLTGADEVLSDDGSLTVGKITTGQDIAALMMRGRAWSVNDLATALSGDDPMGAVADLVAEYWNRMEQTTLINVLTGAFAGTNMSGLVSDISGNGTEAARCLNATTFLTAQQLMGDAKGRLVAIAMHSAVATYLATNDLIDFLPDSEGKPVIKTFMGKIVLENDSCPVGTGTYTTYVFGRGAIARGEGSAPIPVETDRDILAGDDVLVTRRHYLLHPRGVAFQSHTVDGASPSNAEMATAANWARVYEVKNIRMVQIKHKIA